MKKKSSPGRITFKDQWPDMPLAPASGFDSFRKPIPLSMHRHEGYELTYVTEGEVTWEIKDGPPLRLSGGDAAITQPGTFHCGKWDIIQPCGLFWIIFSPAVPDSAKNTPFSKNEINAMDKSLRSAGNKVCPASLRLKECFGFLLELMTKAKNASPDKFALPLARSIFCEIFVLAAELFSQPQEKKKESSLLIKANCFMKEHVSENIGMEKVAEKIGLSSTFFSEAFKKESGMTPSDYFRRMKCEEACRRLISGSSVTETAFGLGFSSSQYFAEVFKKHTGMTPRQYKSKKKN